MDIMFDLETLGTSPDCVILTFGAVKFNPFDNSEPYDPVYYRIDMDYQTTQLERSIDETTLEWWGKQDQTIIDDTFSDEGRIDVEDLIDIFKKYVVGVDRLWSHGATFDVIIMENLFKSMKVPFPVNYWSIYDSRTLLKLMKNNPLKNKKTHKHNALVDAYDQAIAVKAAFKEFNISKV